MDISSVSDSSLSYSSAVTEEEEVTSTVEEETSTEANASVVLSLSSSNSSDDDDDDDDDDVTVSTASSTELMEMYQNGEISYIEYQEELESRQNTVEVDEQVTSPSAAQIGTFVDLEA